MKQTMQSNCKPIAPRAGWRKITWTALLVAGCAGTEPDVPAPAEESRDRIETARALAAAAPVADGLTEVRVRLSESWLEDTLSARYARVPAATAFRLVAQGRPVRFDFDAVGAPDVFWPPNARTVREHLDAIAVQADWSYSLEAGVLVVRDIETRQFILSSQPGAITAQLGLRNLQDTGGSTADNMTDLQMNPYADEILAAVSTVLGLGVDGTDPRTAASIAPSTNLLVVTARPSSMRMVEHMMRDYNAAASRVVRIALSLIEVEFEDGDSRDLALEIIRKSANAPFGMVLDATGGALGWSFRDDPSGAPSDGRSRWSDSNLLFEWLESFGEATITYSDTIEVLNNQIASVDVTRTEQYVSKISLRAVGDSQTVPEVEFRKLRTGLVVHVQPTVVGERITVRLGLSRSTPVSRTPFQFGTVQGANFVTDDLNRLLSISLRNGEPKLLASLSEASTRDRTTRIPIWRKLGIGASSERAGRQRETVMLITADLIGG